MRILLIHQNFPGQYKHLGPALVARGDEVVALTPKVKKPLNWKIAQVSIATMQLHGFVTHLKSGIRGKTFRHRTVGGFLGVI